MKVIDLLNKIANGEEVPKHIHIRDVDSYTWQEDVKEYWSDRDENNLLSDLDLSSTNLKEDVEIIEEDKKIEKMQKIKQRTDTGLFGSMVNDEIKVAEAINKQANYLSDIVSTINEIIDKLNEMEKE